MASDKDLVEQGYEDAVKSVFKVFFSSLSGSAGNPPAGAAQAEQAFQNGLRIARDARDRALRLV